MNVLRDFGQSSIADGAQVNVNAIGCARRLHAIALFSITPPDIIDSSVLSDLADMKALDISDAPLEPARVKWFDKAKDRGSANIVGHPEDVFIHVEILG